MALGRQIGTFSFKATSFTVTPGPGKAMTVQANFEGAQSGDVTGVAVGTLTAVAEAGVKSGPWSWCGLGFLDKGETLSSTGQGTWEESGAKKWRYRGTGQFSDGRSFGVEFDGDLVERVIAGKLYEWK